MLACGPLLRPFCTGLRRYLCPPFHTHLLGAPPQSSDDPPAVSTTTSRRQSRLTSALSEATLAQGRPSSCASGSTSPTPRFLAGSVVTHATPPTVGGQFLLTSADFSLATSGWVSGNQAQKWTATPVGSRCGQHVVPSQGFAVTRNTFGGGKGFV